ncbi:hypothetical protein GW750_04185 [bacterium]|nr:hypothetical protein [bacterium]
MSFSHHHVYCVPLAANGKGGVGCACVLKIGSQLAQNHVLELSVHHAEPSTYVSALTPHSGL